MGLRALNFDVYYVIEQTRSLDDDVLLQIAKDDNRLLITKDKDFGELVYRLNKVQAGVILIGLEGYDTQERADIICRLVLKI